MMSAWPACCAVSAMMCNRTRRADHDAPCSNQGASGSGWAASRSGRPRTSSSVSPATCSYRSSSPASVSPPVILNIFIQVSAMVAGSNAIAEGPSTMNSVHCRSVAATCLISPPRHNSLTVVRCAACSSVSPRVVSLRKWRCLASEASRSARSPVRACVLPAIWVSLVLAFDPIDLRPARYPAAPTFPGRVTASAGRRCRRTAGRRARWRATRARGRVTGISGPPRRRVVSRGKGMCRGSKRLRPGMTRVVVATGYGGPDVLSVIDEPAGEPRPGQARIEVRAAGVNPVDYKVYSGVFGRDPANLPLRIGSEAAGVVVQVGQYAIGPAGPVRAGDEVIAYRVSGAYAADLIAPVPSLLPKPASVSWPQASGLMLTGVTAWHCLVATGVSDGDTVLIHGGAGGVGLMAVQLAALRGATVIATASPARHELLRELGAIAVSYGPGLANRVRAVAPGCIDAALDLVGTDEAVDVSIELVADRTRIATIAAFGRAGQERIKALGGAPGADPGTEIRSAARLELARLAGEGKLRVFIAAMFPLAQVSDAHRAIMKGHTSGKIALIP